MESSDEAAKHHRQGNLYQDEGKLDRAIISYRRALKLDADNAELYNDLGTAYFSKGFLDDAVKNFRQSIARRRDHDIAHANLGAALRRQGKLQEARRAYQAALGIRARRSLGRWLPFLRTRSSAARPGAAQALEAAKAAGDLARAQSLGEERVNANPNDAAALASLASVYLERKYFASAIEFYSRALALRPHNAAACFGLGKAYVGLGAAGDAVRCFGNAIAIEPEMADAHVQLGYALNQLDRDAGAEQSFSAALRIDPARADAMVGLALVLRDQDRLEEAIAAVRRHQPRGLGAPEPPRARRRGDRALREGAAHRAESRAPARQPRPRLPEHRRAGGRAPVLPGGAAA
jgi:tetratricopeptide (TPR) repeat protein